MNRILLLMAVLCLALTFNSFGQCGCKFIINANSPYVWDGVKMGVKPGDKICFANGQRPDIMLMNIHGTAASPVVITNMCDGKVVVKGTVNTGRLLYLGNNSFVRVTGTGNPAEQYGIEIQTGVQGIDFRDLSTDVEADHLYVHDLSYSGINAKTDPTCDPATWRGNFVMRNVLVHDNKISATGGEGIYIGESHYQTTVTVTPCNLQAQEHEVIGCQVYNNVLTNIGRDGIQVGSATTNCSIHDNSIYNFGMTHEGFDASGIQINPGTNAETYNNIIDTGFGFGVFAGGRGGSHLYNNIISNCGMGGICSAAYAPVDPSGFIFSNNTLVNNTNLGIQSYANNTPNTFVNNIIVAPATGTFKYVDANAPGIKWTESNNIKTNDISSLKFIDGAGKNFRLQTTSPAKDAGISMTAKGITFDLDRLPRPSGAAFDIGAYEFQGAVNKPPVSNAGADVVITLPVATTILKGTATDTDGTIASWAWTKISGGVATLTNATTANLSLSGLVAGSYVFRLTVTDNGGATAYDDVALAVLPAINKPPVANAGSDVIVTLPVSIATLKGTATDTDGTIAAWSWSKVSGGAATLANTTTANLSLGGLLQGSYVFRLTVTDNSGATAYDDVTVTVNSAANKPPVANAGVDQIVTLPVSIAILNGTATDTDGTIAAWAWTKISGNGVTLTNPLTATLSLAGLLQGTYVFRLTVTDNVGATGYDDMTITVNPIVVVNKPPVVNAGTDIIITLPVNSTTLNGIATDADGTIAALAWTKISGSTATLTNASTATLSLTSLVQGSYVFRLTATDNSGATATDDVTVTVNAAVVTPTGQVSRFNFTDQKQTIAGWISAVGSPHAAIATASDPATGFAISSVSTAQWPPLQNATPNSSYHGGVTNGTVQPALVVWTQWLNYGAPYGSTVNGVLQGDNVNLTGLNPSKTYTLEMGASRASGSGPDRYGNVEYRVKGVNPQLLLITNNATNQVVYQSVTPDATGKIGISARKVNGDSPMQIGYIGWLVVTETASTGARTTAVTADAGPDQTITLPVGGVLLDGSKSLADGSIASYEWTQLSGVSATLTNDHTPQVTISTLTTGEYVFRLTVTDADGNVGSDDVTVTALDANTLAFASDGSFDFMDKHYPANHTYTVRIFNDSGKLLYSGEWNPDRYNEIFSAHALYLYNVFQDGRKIDAGKVMIVR